MSRFLSKASESLLPYTPGEQPQGRKFIKLNTNECPYPPSPKVAEAILAGYEEIAAGCGTAGAAGRAEKADCGCDAGATEAGKMAEKVAQIMPPELANLRLYSDPEERVLIEAIAAHYRVGTNQVIAGNGSDEILGFAFRAFCDSEAPLQFADLTYGFYPALCGLYGIPFRVVPLEEDFTLNIEPYKNCGNNVIIANPNAPTGMNLPLSAIEEVAASNPDRVVMVDEAYVDFGGESCVSLLPKYENLVIIQTFSKSRSLAGARVGFAIANPELIADMNRIKYSITSTACRFWLARRRCATGTTRKNVPGASAKRVKKRPRRSGHLDLLCWIRRPTSFLPRAAICREKSILTDCARQESW